MREKIQNGWITLKTFLKINKMSNVCEKRECPTCHEFVHVVELIPNKEREGWHFQKLSCSHTGNIRIMEPIEEKIEIKDEVKAVPIQSSMYGQAYAEKTSEASDGFFSLFII
jgi:hypothetical protein